MRLVTLLNSAAAMAAGLALLLMAGLGTADVLGMTVRRPIPGVYEAIETLMVVSIFFAIASAQQSGSHISVELLRALFGFRGKAGLSLLSVLCSAFFFGLVAYFGWSAFLRSWASGEFRQGQIGFPVWPARLALALGAGLMVIQCLRDAALHGRALLAGAHGVGRETDDDS